MKNLPDWLKKPTPKHRNMVLMRDLIGNDVHTVCESAKCPNIGECYSNKVVTFMILGDTCTRGCKFCAVKTGDMTAPDPDEPRKIAEAAKKLGLNYVVVTSVTRDDLPDGGADHFARTIKELQRTLSAIKVEVLIPDFKGDIASLKFVIDAAPDVLNHNVEMVPRLYSSIRPRSDYNTSLFVLKNSKLLNKNIPVKSGFMLGLGETEEEVLKLMRDLKEADCDILTIGQYIPPTQNSAPVVEYVQPEKFENYRDIALSLGIQKVFSGPFVRSSYQAGTY